MEIPFKSVESPAFLQGLGPATHLAAAPHRDAAAAPGLWRGENARRSAEKMPWMLEFTIHAMMLVNYKWLFHVIFNGFFLGDTMRIYGDLWKCIGDILGFTIW